MTDLIAAESAKVLVGKAMLLALIVTGLLLGGVTVVSLTSDAERGIAAGLTTAAAATDNAVRYWITMHLISSIFGALFVTREFGHGTIARSVMLSGGRARLVAAKVIAGSAAGAVLAAVAVLFAAVAPWVVLPRYGITPEWTATTSQVLGGVFAVVLLATIWGVLVGFVARNGVVSVLFLLITTLALDPYLLDLAPSVGRFEFSIALAPLYRDTEPGILPLPAALAVVAAWLIVGYALAHLTFTRRDVP